MANTKKKGLIYYLDKIYKAIKGSDQLPPEGDPSVEGHMANVNKKGLLYYLDIIGDALEEWSPGPGPGPSDISKCVQVDRTQSFSDAEKERGRANLGISVDDFVRVMRKVAGYTLENDITEQQVQDAIKELTAILKNKTIDADDNTILNLETDNFKDTALAKSTDAVRSLANSVDTKLTTEKFLQKTLHNIELPEEDKDAANKKYVDDLVAELEGKILKFKGFVSHTAPTGSIKNGSFWYQGTVMPSAFPVNVRTYNATTGQWSSATKQYTPDALDLWANLNDNKGYYWFGNAWNMLDDNGKVLFVSTFTGLTGDQKMLYYLDNAYGSYKKGFYRFNGTAFVNINPKEFFIVSTFAGVEGDDEALYYLDTAYGDYKVGFYRFIPASGSASAKFVLLDKAFVQYVSTFTGVVGESDVLYYLDTAYGDYKKGFYRFIPAAGSTPAKFELISTEADVFTDVDELPDTDISKATIYRIPYSYYDYNGKKVEKDDVVLYGPGPQCLNMAADNSGLHMEDSSRAYDYTWSQVNDALVQQLMTNEMVAVKTKYEDAEFFRLAANAYGPKDELHEVDGGYKLYHNPTETDGEYIEIGGSVEVDDVTIEEVSGKLRSYAIIDITELPTTGIRTKSFYRFTADYFTHNGVKVDSLIGYKVIDTDIYEVTSGGLLDKRTSTLTTWGDANLHTIVQQAVTDGYIGTVSSFEDAEFFGYPTDQYDNASTFAWFYAGTIWQNMSGTASGWREVGASEGSAPVQTDGLTIEEVAGVLQANAVLDVTDLPVTDIKEKSLYRTRDMSYEYEGVRFPKSDLVWYGPGPDCTSMDADDIGVNIRAASGNRSYPWGLVNAALIQELRDLNLVAVGVDEADAVFFSHFATYGPKSGLTTIYGDYHLYHNPSQTAGGYIEIGGDSVQYVSTFEGVTGGTSILYYLDNAYGSYKVGFYRFNGTFQFIGTDVILTVETLPTTGISDSVFYRLVEYHKFDNGWEIPVENTFMSNSHRMVINPSGIEYTDTQSQIHPYNWADVTDDLVTGWMTDGELKNVPLSDRNLEGKFYKKQDGTYDAMNGGTVYVYIRNEYKLYHNPTKTSSGYVEVGGGSDIVLDEVTTETVDGKVQANAIIDVTALSTTGIKSKTIYRMLVDKYFEDGTALPSVPTGYVSIRPAVVIIDENGITDNGTFYAWADLDDSQMDRFVIRRQISEVYAADLMTMSTCFKTATNHYVYKDHVTKEQVYELYHNPTATANAFIKIGGEGGSSEVDDVTTEDVNGKIQANAIIVVNALPTTDIKTKTLYRRMQTVYKHDGVEVPNVELYRVVLNDSIEATNEGMRYKPSGPVVAWNDASIASVIAQAVADGNVASATWETAEFMSYGDGSYDYETHFSRILPGSLWQNTDGTSAGWKEVGGEPAIDEVTVVEEHGILKAIAVIDVTRLPSSGMKGNSLYRKVETVMVPGLHIYTSYYHGGADPVPEPVECYKPARTGVEFRSNEIYIDGVEHSYEELRAYRADWVAAGYIVACDFLDADCGGVGYPNEGSYQFLNREQYTYNTDPVPVVMNKIFQYTPAGEWESISTVQISQAAYNLLDYEQKMDGTTYIVEG